MLVFDYTVFACHKDVGSMTKVVEDMMTTEYSVLYQQHARKKDGTGKEL